MYELRSDLDTTLAESTDIFQENIYLKSRSREHKTPNSRGQQLQTPQQLILFPLSFHSLSRSVNGLETPSRLIVHSETVQSSGVHFKLLLLSLQDFKSLLL